MKNISAQDLMSKPFDNTIVVCKEEIKQGKSGINITLKATPSDSEIIEGIQLCSFKQRRTSPLDQEEMLKLAKTNPKLFCEKIILSQFGDSYITSEEKGTNYLLPNRIKRFYDKCVSFGNESYQIYFTDLSILYFSDLIEKLKLKRTDDTLKYCSNLIGSGKAENINFTLLDGFDFRKSNSCSFLGNEERYAFSKPKNTLHYHIDLDEKGDLNKQDLENMMKIIELFSEKNNGFRHIEYDRTNLVACTNNQGIFLDSNLSIEGYDKHPELLKHILSLKRK